MGCCRNLTRVIQLFRTVFMSSSVTKSLGRAVRQTFNLQKGPYRWSQSLGQRGLLLCCCYSKSAVCLILNLRPLIQPPAPLRRFSTNGGAPFLLFLVKIVSQPIASHRFSGLQLCLPVEPIRMLPFWSHCQRQPIRSESCVMTLFLIPGLVQ